MNNRIDAIYARQSVDKKDSICFSFNFGPTWPEVNFVKSAYSVRHSLLNVVKYYNQLLFRLRGAT